jgi:hypothetical protein
MQPYHAATSVTAINNQAVMSFLFLWQYLLPKEKQDLLCELCASSEAGGETFFLPPPIP